MHLIYTLILLCGALSVPTTARAQPQAVAEDRAGAERLAAEAKEAFKAGQFDAAAKLFMQAYAKSHTPALLYNAARAHEEAGHKRDAITLFKLYITLTDEADGILDARQRIQRLEAPDPLPLPQMVTPTTVVAVTRPPPARTTEWVLSGSAVAAVGVGLALVVDGAAGTQDHTGVDRSAFDSARTEWFIGAGLVGVGAALGGVSYYFWTRPVTLVPTPKGIALKTNF
jgi:tetratricopeptide (TPR) repeat protein